MDFYGPTLIANETILEGFPKQQQVFETMTA
jgi:hypothetical protein